ncbi:uncharacterized protein LOC127136337 [Lathyrus oleraceus]|uniref:uncharacterized protein LOC127136337 n=1 Tax=Pisum sativum TaxID=3888 RepID=UPI0021D35F1D|nr:uncharacterized protein LOC127136337 [Pisum sativum]
MSYTEFYPSLLKKGLVVPRPLGPPPDPIPPYYNPNAYYPFHEGAPGHDLEDCYALNHIVRELIEKKILSFGDTGPNVKNNTFPAHGSVNAIDDAHDESMILDVAKIKNPLRIFHAKLVEAGLLKNCHKSCEECTIVPKGCEIVRNDIQELINQCMLQVRSRMKKDEVIVIKPILNLPESSTTTPILNMPEPVFNIPDSTVVQPIFNIPESVEPIFNIPKPVVVQRPSPFPFENTKPIHWKYDTTVVNQGSEKVGQKEGLKITSTDIVGGSRMTRSGHIYTPQFNLAPPIPLKETTTTVTDKGKWVVPIDADTEFLRLIKKSDYKIIDQLHQTPSKISIQSLLMSSPTHRSTLQKLLAQAHVTHKTTIDQFDGIITNITACNNLSFSREDLPKDGQNHNRALHISMKFQEDTITRVLVDTCSSMNVLPKRTLAKLSYKGDEMRPSTLIVKAFDRSRRTAIGEVELPILIDPHVFKINFQVMEINPNYSCLLGRPWIHAVGAVTSTLRQKMKFVIDDKLVIVSGEEDLMVSHLSLFSYIEADKDALETYFQALEIANVVLMEVEEPKGKAIPSFASWKKVRSTIEEGSP